MLDKTAALCYTVVGDDMNKEITIVYKRKGRTLLDDKRHMHDDEYELIQSLTNDGSVLIGDKLYPMTYGSVYFIRSMCIHRTVPDKPDEYMRNIVKFKSGFIFDIAEKLNSEILSDRLLGSSPGFYSPLSQDTASLIDHRISELMQLSAEQTEPLADLRLSIEAISLLCIVLQNASDQETIREKGYIGDALRYLGKHFCEPVTVDELSRVLNVSKYHLCRSFRRRTGMTIVQYITSCRLSLVKRRLISEDTGITEIALESGFCSYNYFCSLFRREEGVSPSEYRRQHKQ